MQYLKLCIATSLFFTTIAATAQNKQSGNNLNKSIQDLGNLFKKKKTDSSTTRTATSTGTGAAAGKAGSGCRSAKQALWIHQPK